MGVGAFEKPRQLCPEDDLGGFCCGVDAVDNWLATRAKDARRLGTAVVYVSYCGGSLAGFYTLSSQSVARAGVRGWLSRNAPNQIPVILLGMLGIDKRWQDAGLGKQLLLDAVHRAMEVSEAIGARALVVDPANEDAKAFYEHYGFRTIPGTDRMYAKL